MAGAPRNVKVKFAIRAGGTLQNYLISRQRFLLVLRYIYLLTDVCSKMTNLVTGSDFGDAQRGV